ncbi:MAG: hypothetical protein OXO52_14910, partial [Rhodospirillales bacterium]|nr:hypothetical protein [Rhodospirillales bacterium]
MKMNMRIVSFVAPFVFALMMADEAAGDQCPLGFQWNGSACEKFHVPANAHVNVFNTGWVCNKGYER